MKTINFLLFFTIIFSLFYYSCTESGSTTKDEDFFDFTEPTIESVKPGNRESGVSPNQHIKISFNEKMDKSSVEQAFSLSSVTGEGNTDGNLSWDGDDTLVYSPIDGWTIGQNYQISLSTSARDINRNHLLKSLISYFYVGEDHENPYVLPPEPIQNVIYDQINPLDFTIAFSKAMDETSLLNAITLPNVNYWTEIVGGSSLRITSMDELEPGSTYTLTISKDAKSTTGLPMLDDYVYDFAMTRDLILPEILDIKWCYTENDYIPQGIGLEELLHSGAQVVAINNNILTFNGNQIALEDIVPEPAVNATIDTKMCSFIIIFSEAMNRRQTERALSLTGVDFQLYWTQTQNNGEPADVLLVKPTVGLEHSREYTLYIDNSAEDLAGNEMRSDSSNYYLKLDCLPPKITRIQFDLVPLGGNNTIDLTNSQGYTNEKIEVHLPPGTISDANDDYCGTVKFRVYFDDNSPREFDDVILISFYDNISVEYRLGYKKVSPFCIYRLRHPDNDPDENYFELEFTNLYFNLDEDNNQYIVRINGGVSGVRDTDGFNMEEDKIEVTFVVTGVD